MATFGQLYISYIHTMQLYNSLHNTYMLGIHVYEFEVSEIHRDDIKHPSIMYSRGGYGSPTVIGVISTDAIKASIEILDMGYTPVKLLNPKEHD